MNYKWNYQPPTLEEREAAKALAKEIASAQFFAGCSYKEVLPRLVKPNAFSAPQLNELHDPFLMKDMSLAVERPE